MKKCSTYSLSSSISFRVLPYSSNHIIIPLALAYVKNPAAAEGLVKSISSINLPSLTLSACLFLRLSMVSGQLLVGTTETEASL